MWCTRISRARYLAFACIRCTGKSSSAAIRSSPYFGPLAGTVCCSWPTAAGIAGKWGHFWGWSARAPRVFSSGTCKWRSTPSRSDPAAEWKTWCFGKFCTHSFDSAGSTYRESSVRSVWFLLPISAAQTKFLGQKMRIAFLVWASQFSSSPSSRRTAGQAWARSLASTSNSHHWTHRSVHLAQTEFCRIASSTLNSLAKPVQQTLGLRTILTRFKPWRMADPAQTGSLALRPAAATSDCSAITKMDPGRLRGVSLKPVVHF